MFAIKPITSIWMTVCLLLSAFPIATAAAEPPVNSSSSGAAIEGYDPVAYFTESRAVKGDRDYTYFSENAEKRIVQANQNWKRLALSP